MRRRRTKKKKPNFFHMSLGVNQQTNVFASSDRQKDEIETSLADLYTSCEFVEKALTHGSETEILLVKKQVGDRLVEYSQMQVVQEPAENRYLVFQPGRFMAN